MPATESPDTERLSAQFRALGDRTRLRILELLRGGECCVCELADAVGATQPLLSHHLRTLKEAGLVSDRRDGRWNHYSARIEELERIGSQLVELRTPAPERRCCAPEHPKSRPDERSPLSCGVGNEGQD